jgi:hypothetical protein
VTDQKQDKEFEVFLTGESELADRYTELGREEPPPELDAQILAEARNAAKVHRVEFGPRGGWLKPVALAATVLLSLSLVMNIIVDTPVRFEQVVTQSTKTDIRPDAEFALEELRSLPEKKNIAPVLPAATVARDRDMVVEEQALVARKLPAGSADDIPQSIQMAEPGVRSINRDAALLVVALYVAAADSGRVESDVMEREFMRKAEGAQPAMQGSLAADRVTAAADEHQPDDVFEHVSDDNPESLLRDIERLNASGASAEAGTLLDEFLTRYPDHPVSVKIRQQGD